MRKIIVPLVAVVAFAMAGCAGGSDEPDTVAQPTREALFADLQSGLSTVIAEGAAATPTPAPSGVAAAPMVVVAPDAVAEDDHDHDAFGNDIPRATSADTTGGNVRIAADPVPFQPAPAAAQEPAAAHHGSGGGGAASAAPSSGGGCVSNCGTPRFFCDTWAGGFCDDFRGKASGAAHVAFPQGGDPYSYDALGSSQTGYETSGATDGGLRAFSANEHFMTVVDDETFGMGVLRVRQPFDFAGRTGHIHFDADLKTSARRYIRLMLSPDITKTVTDDREPNVTKPETALDIWLYNGTFVGHVTRGGSRAGGFSVDWPRHYGTDDVRDAIDVYVSRNHVRVLVNGVTYVDTGIADLGFDRAYVYLSQVSYNPCKDGECSQNLQVWHWDNIAFDGPWLPINGLTPRGTRMVAFNAFSALNCSVRGVAAASTGALSWGRWVTWVAALPSDGSPVGPGDVSCAYDFSQDGSDRPRGFEIISQ